jgi:hypothetical protein
MSDIRPEVVEEALRIAEEAERRELALRLLGGIAIKLRAKDGLLPVFRREYGDSDWITPKGTAVEAQKLFEALGYSPQVRFNAIYGRERLLFLTSNTTGRWMSSSAPSGGPTKFPSASGSTWRPRRFL